MAFSVSVREKTAANTVRKRANNTVNVPLITHERVTITTQAGCQCFR